MSPAVNPPGPGSGNIGSAAVTVRRCAICGREFATETRRRTCSDECKREAIRRAKLGPANAAYRNGISRDRDRWASAKENGCRVCGSRDRLLLHHVVYEQHVRRLGGDAHDPDNSFTVCFTCHMKHHDASDFRISICDLRGENWGFVRALLGEAWVHYFDRYYDTGVYPPWIEEDELWTALHADGES